MIHVLNADKHLLRAAPTGSSLIEIWKCDDGCPEPLRPVNPMKSLAALFNHMDAQTFDKVPESESKK